MPDLWMDVDAALTEVPVNILPLIDDTDFKTIEGAVAYNAAGMALFWHFVTTAGAYTLTAVTPTTAGDYDWTDQGAAGIYTIEIPASGGASVNNDTEGFGWFTGVATGILPWRGPTIGFRAAALNNAMIDGGDTLDVNVTEWLGTAAATPTVAGVPEVDLTHVAGSTTSVSALASGVATLLADWINGGRLDLILDIIAADTTTDIPATLTTIAGYIDTEIAAIKAKTDNLPTDPADQSAVEAAILAAWTTALTESYNADGSPPTPAQALFLIMQRLTEFAISGTTITVKKLDGSTTAATLTLDDATGPTSSTRAT